MIKGNSITPEIKQLLNDFLKLSVEDRNTFINFIAAHSSPSSERTLIDTKFAEGMVCPHCGAKDKGVHRHGKTKGGKQRFYCSHCKRFFGVTTGSVMYHTKKDFQTWRNYISCFLNGFTIRKCAYMVGINKNTAFLWRHKICESLNNIMNGVKLGGIVEADETYFRVSYKGGEVLEDRKPRKRGSSMFHKDKKRGLSSEQVCVPTAVNRSGKSVAKIAEVGKGSLKGVEAVIGDHLEAGSTLCADGAAWYGRIATKHGMKRVRVGAKESKKGKEGIQHVNAYHSGLKRFVDRFYGISTKHLNDYLMWFNFAQHAKEAYGEKVRILTNHIVTTNSYIRRVDIARKPAIPYVCEGVRRIAG